MVLYFSKAQSEESASLNTSRQKMPGIQFLLTDIYTSTVCGSQAPFIEINDDLRLLQCRREFRGQFLDHGIRPVLMADCEEQRTSFDHIKNLAPPGAYLPACLLITADFTAQFPQHTENTGIRILIFGFNECGFDRFGKIGQKQ